jgi:hypothetical protein
MALQRQHHRAVPVITLLAAGLLAPIHAMAVSITYTLTNLSGNVWRYDYTIDNDSLVDPIEAFRIYFDDSPYDDDDVSPYGGLANEFDFFDEASDPTRYNGIGLYGFTGLPCTSPCPELGAPAGWNDFDDMLLLPADEDLELHPYLDGWTAATAPSASILFGQSLGGFWVAFEWLGIGAPSGGQDFEIYDPESFEILATGVTTAPPPAVIPVPGAASLFISALAALGRLRARDIRH